MAFGLKRRKEKYAPSADYLMRTLPHGAGLIIKWCDNVDLEQLRLAVVDEQHARLVMETIDDYEAKR